MIRAGVVVLSLSAVCLAYACRFLPDSAASDAPVAPAAAQAPALALSSAPAGSVHAVVHYHHHEQYTANLTLSVDGQTACGIALRDQPKYAARECSFALPPTAREVSLNGEFAFKDKYRRSRARGTQRWRIVDLAPLLTPLRDTARPFGQRFRAFMKAKTTLEETLKTLGNDVPLEPEQAETAEAIKAAEGRLGFALPPEHVSLLRDVGAIDLGDSGFQETPTLDRADKQMLKEWGTPASAMKELTPETMALLRATTMLYTEAGDGLGALLYEPALPGRPSACGQQPAFYWIHQDQINSPEQLTRADGKTCRTYTEAMIWLLAQEVLHFWEDEDPDIVFVDRGAPTWFHLELSHRYERNVFSFELMPRWDSFE